MMKLYSIYDNKAGFYGNPFVAHNAADATRSFQHAANDEQTLICKNPDDFELFEIGEFDVMSALFFPQDRVSLGCATQYKSSK